MRENSFCFHLYNETIKPVLPGLIRRFFDWIFSDSVLVKTVMNFLCAWMKKTEWMCFLFSCWKIFQILWKLKIYPSCVFFSLCVWALNILEYFTIFSYNSGIWKNVFFAQEMFMFIENIYHCFMSCIDMKLNKQWYHCKKGQSSKSLYVLPKIGCLVS